SERLDGSNKYRCDHCRSLQPALKRFLLSRVPPLLSIHLKRFDFSGGGGGYGGGGSKLSHHVAFPLLLDLAPYLTRALKDFYVDGNVKGRLFAVVVHQGHSLHSGHYYAFVRSLQDNGNGNSNGNSNGNGNGNGNSSCNDWFCMNDSYVRPVEEREVLKANAYMLFYSVVATENTLLPPPLSPSPSPSPSPHVSPPPPSLPPSFPPAFIGPAPPPLPPPPPCPSMLSTVEEEGKEGGRQASTLPFSSPPAGVAATAVEREAPAAVRQTLLSGGAAAAVEAILRNLNQEEEMPPGVKCPPYLSLSPSLQCVLPSLPPLLRALSAAASCVDNFQIKAKHRREGGREGGREEGALCEESFKTTCEASFDMYLENVKREDRENLYAAMARKVVREGGRE
ncbi:hypothetical protein VYU27_010360, partial [Nannochloropsis oceanica]